jgi:hypothetical protein
MDYNFDSTSTQNKTETSIDKIWFSCTGSSYACVTQQDNTYNLWQENPFLLQSLYNPSRQRHMKRSAYIVGIIGMNVFVNYFGAVPLKCGVYYIAKEYKGTPNYETCALLGIPKHFIADLIHVESNIVNSLRTDPNLSHIPGIEKLSAKHISEVLSRFAKNLYLYSSSTDLILFNIEPMGTSGKLKRCYPVARLTIPGGTMDDIDNHSFEMCGLREFKEETGIDISFCHREISRHKVKRFNKKKRWFGNDFGPPPGLGFTARQNPLYEPREETQPNAISMYFLVKISQ